MWVAYCDILFICHTEIGIVWMLKETLSSFPSNKHSLLARGNEKNRSRYVTKEAFLLSTKYVIKIKHSHLHHHQIIGEVTSNNLRNFILHHLFFLIIISFFSFLLSLYLPFPSLLFSYFIHYYSPIFHYFISTAILSYSEISFLPQYSASLPCYTVLLLFWVSSSAIQKCVLFVTRNWTENHALSKLWTCELWLRACLPWSKWPSGLADVHTFQLYLLTGFCDA